jgi:predicted nucleic acid-binding Zn finger protein
MNVTSHDDKNVSDVEPRTLRALEEYMTVLPEEGTGLCKVYTESGSEYTVDPHDGACTCPDMRHNLGHNESCKHVRRARFALGIDAVPTDVDGVDVNEELGKFTDTPLRFATADGGIVEATDDAEVPEEDDEEEVCDECAGLDGLPCFECYMEARGHLVDMGGD